MLVAIDRSGVGLTAPIKALPLIASQYLANLCVDSESVYCELTIPTCGSLAPARYVESSQLVTVATSEEIFARCDIQLAEHISQWEVTVNFASPAIFAVKQKCHSRVIADSIIIHPRDTST